jgi:predicted AAA+ superfamily ATPase
MKEARNVSQITELIEKLSGRQVVINCIVDQSVEISSPAEAVSGNESPDIENISNIFGSAELLES